MSVATSLLVIDDTTTPEALQAPRCTLVVGNFDGVHRGHQAVLGAAVAEARGKGLAACVLTFEPHPAAVVGRGAPPLLTTMVRRSELMSAIGVSRTYVRRFDTAFASWSPQRFARDLVAERLRACVVVVGDSFRFGAKRAGDLALLRELGGGLGFEARVHPVAADERGHYSSTRAREAVAAADLDEACRVLGRPHSLSGTVVHGDKLGRTIGFPTANLDLVPEMLPPDGVYAVLAHELDARGRPLRRLGRGATSIGWRPTVGGTRRTVETFLLDFSGDLYGASLRLDLIAWLRQQEKFASLKELEAEIGRDVVRTERAVARVTGS
ncbi:MAG: bifunctional riboflavin kinase/FAD synthetase [Myxococcota bacterium]|nr:bifunctional riboflavin kinase/FAD synthetase [Myxococcota bacterium]